MINFNRDEINKLLLKKFIDDGRGKWLKTIKTTYGYGLYVLKDCKNVLDYYINRDEFITNAHKEDINSIKNKDLEQKCFKFKSEFVFLNTQINLLSEIANLKGFNYLWFEIIAPLLEEKIKEIV